ncbi:MAG: PD-(D/E)XK nuclease family protein, partial [Clostridiales bacterium]
RHMQGGSFVPVAFELPFGRNEPHSLPPLRIDLPEGRKLLLSGQIDRVDMAQGQEKSWFRIVDYKTGKLNLTPQDIFTGLRLQLLVYLQVVLDNSLYFSAREAAAAGIYYGPVHDELINCAIGEQPPEAMQLLGITVQDPEAIKLADRDIDGYSKLIKVAYSEKKGFYANSPGVTPPQLQLLQQHLLRILRDTAGQMAEGIIAAQPMSQKGFLVCDFCDQQEFCGLDRDYAGIITVENPDKEQLWQILAGGAENEQL